MISLSDLIRHPKLPVWAEMGKISNPTMHMKFAFRGENTETEIPPSDDLRQKAEKAFGMDLSNIDMREFTRGLNIEREHDDVTNGDWKIIAKIVIAHLKEIPDYYTRLAKMEETATPSQSLPIIRKSL